MKKGDILTGQVLRTDFPNKGIVYHDDHKIIVKNALEGQTIQFSISKKRKDRMEGRLLSIITPSTKELPTPACQHFGQCGGCAYQNLPYNEQLLLKKRQVENLIKQAGFSFQIEEVIASPVHEGYRNKMEYTFGDEEKDGPLTLGLHKRNSFYDIVPLSDCRIVDPDFNILLYNVLKYFKNEGKSFYHRMRHEGFLRHLVLRRSVKTGDILINLVTSSQDSLDREAFVGQILKLSNQQDSNRQNSTKSPVLKGKIAGILHTINDSLADVVKSDETHVLYGHDYIEEYLFDLKFKITPFSFFQTNTLSAELLYSKVREYVGDTKDKLIYDLYCGTGTISQILAPVARKVVGVEIVEEAVEAARQNAQSNGLTNCEFIAGDVLKVIDNLIEKPDIIVLDPPRDGINPKALKKIIQFGVKELVYVSCKPSSLMRDLIPLQDAGYEVKRCCLVDQFPGTVHVETVCLLTMTDIEERICKRNLSGGRIHIIGIGGSSMSGLALLLKNRGYTVSGSSIGDSEYVSELLAEGIDVMTGDCAEHVDGADLVVYSHAIQQNNVELIATRENGIPVMSRSQLLGQISKEFRRSVSVCGTHGKTTVTSMLAQILIEAETDPTVHIGGILPSMGGNVRIGKSDLFLTEACEFQQSFLCLNTSDIVLLNIDEDHLDCYRDIDEIESTFGAFLQKLPADGWALGNGEDERVVRQLRTLKCRSATFGFSDSCDYQMKNAAEDTKGFFQFDFCYRQEKLGHVRMAIPGSFNAKNAAAALAEAHHLGIDMRSACKSIESFTGAHRRFERTGNLHGAEVFHDYGHNPTEMQNALSIARKRCDHGRLWAVMQPHTYSRVKALFQDYLSCTQAADITLVTDIYAAREDDPGDINSGILVEGMKTKGIKAIWTPSFEDAATMLHRSVRPGDLVLTMGCGNIYLLNDMLRDFEEEAAFGCDLIDAEQLYSRTVPNE